MDGVLKSWALPHGPTLDPSIKRLAVLVEDHPLDYGSFEGTIPAGNYGAGQVILWDRGSYQWLGEKTPAQQWEAGDLKLKLHGQKLMGEFALVRTNRSKDRGRGRDWLLIKKKDFAVREGWDPESDIRSVLPDRHDLSAIVGTVGAPMPLTLAPMMAVPGTEVPVGPEWLYEVKWDGVRAMCFKEGTKVRILSRKETAIEHQYPELVNALATALTAETAILDGEIVSLDESGVPSFQLLQNRIGATPMATQRYAQAQPVSYYAFDLLYLDGFDLRKAALLDRRQLLASVLNPNEIVRRSEHFTGKGLELLQAVREKGLEGIVAKSANSIYESRRSANWIKIKVATEQDFVICGYVPGEREYFGALLLGCYRDRQLMYAGNVGSGFTQASLKLVHERMQPLIVPGPALSGVPKEIGPVTWLTPELVCNVKFNSWTNDDRLRSPVFLGLRFDASPQECVRETCEPVSASPADATQAAVLLPPDKNEISLGVQGRQLKFTNLNKIFYPLDGYTKRDVVNYYAAVADLLVPHLNGRPLSLKRYPNGIESDYFFQKEAATSFPDWLHTELISTGEDDSTRLVIADDKAALLYLANLGCIDQNPWMSRVGSLENPDFILIDLDPYRCGYDRIIEAALLLRQKLEWIGLQGYPKTTGGNGMHIYIPVEPRYSYPQTRAFAEILARWVAAERPELFTMPRSVAAREKGKVYFDWIQNSSGKTISAPYVLRARSGAPVATPLEWDEVRPALKPEQFHIGNVLRRFARTGDLFAGVLHEPQEIETALARMEKLIAR